MNFIEAALTLLEKSRKSLSAEELAERAVKESLLSKPGKDPTRSMKAALRRELGKEDDSRVAEVGDDRWRLAKGTAKPSKKAAKTTRKTGTSRKKSQTARATGADKKAGAEKKSAGAKKTRAAKKSAPTASEDAGKQGRKQTAEKEPVEGAEPARSKRARGRGRSASESPDRRAEAAEPAAGKDRQKARAAPSAPAPSADQAAAQRDQRAAIEQRASAEVAEVLAPKERPRRAAAPIVPADDDIAELYGDELSGTEPGAAFSEYRDAQTDDEDRPMMPEIVASRRDRQKRERRKKRRDRRGGEEEARTEGRTRGRERDRDRDKDRDRPAPHASAGREVQAPRLEPEPTPSGLPFYRVGSALGDGAAEILDAARDGQPMQVKQMAQMMHKHDLGNGRPEVTWAHLKAALLADEAGYRAHGLRPRMSYRGRDLFARGRTATGELGARETAVINAADALAQATHHALKDRLSRLERAALERVVHVYLLRQGWRNLTWIKQVQKTSYAVGEPPGGLGQVLVGVRAGREPIDRRGIGELRVGVQAKNLTSGFLIAPEELSELAREELRRPGPSVSLLVGDSLVSALAQSGIGTTVGQVPAVCFDGGFFDEIERA